MQLGMSVSRTLGVLLVLALGFPAVATAADAPCATHISKKAVPEATRLAQEAKHEVNIGHYDAARQLYERAYCLLPESILKHGLSTAELDMGRCDDALRDARFWVDHAAAKNAVEAQDWMDEVIRHCAEVTVISAPDGAALIIDGGAPVGKTPWHGLLKDGDHTLTARLQGYVDAQTRVTIPATISAPMTFNLALQSAPPQVVPIPAPASTAMPATPSSAPPEHPAAVAAALPPAAKPPPPAAPPPAPAAAPPPSAPNLFPPAVAAPPPAYARSEMATHPVARPFPVVPTVLLGAGVAAGVIGTVIGFNTHVFATGPSTEIEFTRSGQYLPPVAAMVSIAAAAAATGIVLFIIDAERAPKHSAPAPAVMTADGAMP
jgi:hypothetical protein